MPLLQGEDWNREQPICFEWFGDRAVWLGDLKGVHQYQKEWELYDLSTDRTESNDIAASHPDTIAKMDSIYNAWANANGVIAWSEEMGKKTQFRKQPH